MIPIPFGVKLAGYAAALSLTAWFSHHYTAMSYETKIAQQQLMILELKNQQSIKTVEIVTKYVDRVREVKVRGDEIIKEVPIYVNAQADAACVIPAGFVRLHDKAAGHGDGNPPGDSDAAPSGVALSTVAETIGINYTIAKQNAEQLKALQSWVKAIHGPQVQNN